MFAATLACVSATPLGDEVDPDVNCTNAMSSSAGGWPLSIGGASQSSAHNTTCRSGQAVRGCSNDGARARVVSTARAPEACRIDVVCWRERGRSPGLAGGGDHPGGAPPGDAANKIGQENPAAGR